jgi:hypothetical protein
MFLLRGRARDRFAIVVSFGVIVATRRGSRWDSPIGRANPLQRRLEAYDADMDLDGYMARSNARARRGRRIARQLFAIPVVSVGIVAFLYLNQPNTMYEAPPNPFSMILFGAAIVVFLIGLAWMARILRAHQEREVV